MLVMLKAIKANETLLGDHKLVMYLLFRLKKSIFFLAHLSFGYDGN